MLEQGKITATEAADLLRALREQSAQQRWVGPDAAEYVARGADRAEQAARRMGERVQRLASRGRRQAEYLAQHADVVAARAAEHASRAAEQIGENVGRILSNLPDYVDRAARSGWGAWGPGHRFEETVEGELEGDGGPGGLDLEGWNGPVRLLASDDRRVRLVLRKTVHAASEDEARAVAAAVTAVVFGRQVSVHRSAGAPSWPGGLAIEAHLPRAAAWGGIVRTGNGAIEADGLTLRGLRLETSNGRVQLGECSAQDLTAVTSNGRIEVEGVSGQVELRTSNGGISVGAATGDGEGHISAVTSNGPIDVHLAAGLAVDLEATTTNGRVDASGLPDGGPQTQGAGRAELRWRSPDWDAHPARTRIALRTSNGNIRFR